MLLTGATGFVGGYVQKEMQCIPLSDALGTIDITNLEKVTAAVSEICPDMVIHLAAKTFIPDSFKDPINVFNCNFLGTYNLLMALRSSGFKGRLLYTGSYDMYGLVQPENLPITESQVLKPRNPYSVSKVAAEALCYQWSQASDFDVIMARPFNHTGPGQSTQFVVADFANQLREIQNGHNKPVIAVGDIDVTRDFVDVRDVVHAYKLLLERGRNGEVYNVCSGKERSIRQLLETMIELIGIEVSVIQDRQRLRRDEQRRVYGSYDKIHADTGWHPEFEIKDTLREMLHV